MEREIIVGRDSTKGGEDAMALGRALADALGPTRLVAVTVGDHVPPEAVPRSAGRASSEGEVESRALSDDSPAHALHALAEAEDPILIVLGSTHRGPLGRVLIGGVGEALLSGAPCPIAVAPSGYAEWEEGRLLRIGVAVNGSAESWRALDAGVRLAQRLNAAFTLLAVADPHGPGIGAASSVPAPDPSSLRQEGMVRALDEATDRVPSDLPVARRLLRGDPADQLAGAAEDLDLLILGSRGYGPLRSVLLGGVSSKLMRTAPCPVLILPRGAAADHFA